MKQKVRFFLIRRTISFPGFVGRGPSHATRAGERVPLAMHRMQRRFFVQSNDRGGQAPALRKKRHVTVGRGPSHATRAGERVPLAMHRMQRRFFVQSNDRGGQAPALRKKRHITVGRGPVPRHALAGDRPPHYGPEGVLVLTPISTCSLPPVSSSLDGDCPSHSATCQ